MRLTPRGLLFRGRCLPAEIGRAGLSAAKHEGDGATPIGTLHILGMLYRADRLARPAPWARPIGPRDLWCDAPADPAYNHPVRAPFSASHERMARPDPLYGIGLIAGWSHPQARPGKGSAIFLHQRRRPGYPTAGCIALCRKDLLWLARHLRPGTGLVIPDLACFHLRANIPGSGAAPRPNRPPRDKA